MNFTTRLAEWMDIDKFFSDSLQEGDDETESAQTATDGIWKQRDGCDTEIKTPDKILSRDTGSNSDNNNIQCQFILMGDGRKIIF